LLHGTIYFYRYGTTWGKYGNHQMLLGIFQYGRYDVHSSNSQTLDTYVENSASLKMRPKVRTPT